MSGLPKLILPKTFVFVTFRMEEGLPLVPVEFINEIIWSSLAKAQNHYPVRVCAFDIETNHAHMGLFVDNPEDVSLFVGYFKQEVSHGVNRLLGKRKRTNWAEGFDSPTILDADKALEKLAYILLNPVKDSLSDTMDNYPGVSSWKLFRDNKFKRKCRHISRDSIPRLKDPHRPWRESKEVLDHLEKHNEGCGEFTLSPYAWKEAFPETRDLSDEEVRELMLRRIQIEAEAIAADHKERKLPPPNPKSLPRQSILKAYLPSVFGKRMLCLSSIVALRKPFIAFYKNLRAEAAWVLSEWRRGNWSLRYPPGLFPPSLPRRANLLPSVAMA